MSTEETRLALIRAAEVLFAARGVQQVSLGEITQAAGQKNRSAVQYHFGDKRVLIEALLERHSTPIQAGWLALFPAMEAAGSPSLTALVQLLVHSLVAKLDDPDNGPEYIAVCAQLVSSPSYPLMEMRASWAPGAVKLGALMMAVTKDVPTAIRVRRMQRVAGVLYQSIADYSRVGGVSRKLFVADLIDSLVGLIAAPISETTRRALET